MAKKHGKQFSTLEETILEKYNKLTKQQKELIAKVAESDERERIERYLKNEAYAFLLAEGLLDKFLEFRETFHRTKPQEVLFSLVTEADMGGLWIDLYA
jgi:glutathionylspermidine synthase